MTPSARQFLCQGSIGLLSWIKHLPVDCKSAGSPAPVLVYPSGPVEYKDKGGKINLHKKSA
jgi:hypothetical protein